MKIAISGKCTSGKSTTAKLIKSLYKNMEILNFAGRLKELATELYNYDDNNKDRKLLLDFGNAIRTIDPLALINSLDKLANNLDSIIIDDLRLCNEYTYLKEKGYIIIRLNISTDVQLERLKRLYPKTWEEQAKRLNHFTETELDNHKFDYTFNSDNIEVLNNNILNLFLNLNEL